MIKVSPAQQKIAISIGLSLLTLGIILHLQAPQTTGNPSPSISTLQSKSSKCEHFLRIDRDLNQKIVNQDGIANAGTLEVISMNKDAKEWEAEQTTQIKGNKNCFREELLAIK